MVEWQYIRVISEHLSYFLLGEARHLIELWSERVVGADVEATCQVVHCYRADACNEDTSQCRACRPLDGVEEKTEIALAMCLVAVTLQVFLVGKDVVGEVVVLVDEEINLLSCISTFLAQISQLGDGTFLILQSFLCAKRKQVGISVAT